MLADAIKDFTVRNGIVFGRAHIGEVA